MSVSPAKRASFIPRRCSVEGTSKSTEGEHWLTGGARKDD